MKNLESLKSELFNKQIDANALISVQGGYTLTGCSYSGGGISDCSDTDEDKKEVSIAQ
ncbi:hypothetical protein ACJD0Z_03425 [Flavobacteriaceae bacterium M23B6Z8]